MNNFFKNINFKIFFTAFIVLIILVFLSFFCAGAEDEGTLGESLIGLIGAKSFFVFRFPTHTLFWGIVKDSFLLYVLGLIINSAFYAFLIERIIYLAKIRRMNSEK